jgi:2-phospho-L-lactate guanylyltransferase (CobY/MobA/RfbA family)
MPTGTIVDHYGMGIDGDLAADLAEMMVHGGGIAESA